MYEILFQYGKINIRTFNLFLVIAFIYSIIFLVRYIQLKKMYLGFLVNNLFYFLLAAVLGGKIFYVFEHFINFKQNPLQIFYFWDFNYSSFGMFYSLVLVLLYLCIKNKQDFWLWLDSFVLSGLSALIFIHISNFLTGDHYGIATNLPWGVSFDTFNIALTIPIHPVQLYSAFISFIILIFSVKYVKRTHLTGVSATIVIMLYSISAFLIDFLHFIPSNYARFNYLFTASIAFISYIYRSHTRTIDK